jgi:hypothetical protein
MQVYLDLFEQYCSGLLAACFIYGSVALDAYDPRQSDVDCICILNRRCNPSDLDHLQQIHIQMAQRYPAIRLECSYHLWKDLGQPATSIAPGPAYIDGHLQPQGRLNVNPLTWWQLKNQAITLIGPEAKTLDFDIAWSEVISWMRDNLNTYWRRYTNEPRLMVWLLGDGGIQWVVLGVLRQVYSFREAGVVSKIAAGNYALERLPAQWHCLIREALRIRQGDTMSTYQSRPMRAVDAWRFLRFVIHESNGPLGGCNDQV